MKIPHHILRRPLLSGWGSCILTLGLLFSTARAAEPAPGGFFFHDGDRAMILGDSITQQRMYSALVESYVLSRFPAWKITFRNTGWSGDTMGLRLRGGVDKGFDRDLKPLAPTAVTVDFGMNDARAGEAGAAAYVENAKKLAGKFSALGTRVAFITSSPEEKYEAGKPAGSAYNVLLRKYSAGLKQVAADKGLVFVDQLDPMIAVIEQGRAAGVLSATDGTARLVPGGVHPNWDGHLVMASAILKGLGAPADVSSVEIDAATGAVKATKAAVSDVKTGVALSFTRLDECMPWPVPGSIATVVKIPGFDPFGELSRYMLTVTGLTAPRYDVTADGKPFGTYTKEQLAQGVNLTSAARTALPEVNALMEAILAKNQLFFTRWREVQVAEIPDWIPAAAVEEGRQKRLAELDAQLTAADAKIDHLRAPKSHQWTVSPTP